MAGRALVAGLLLRGRACGLGGLRKAIGRLGGAEARRACQPALVGDLWRNGVVPAGVGCVHVECLAV